MARQGWRASLARYAAPLAFFAAATAAVLLVRAGLDAGKGGSPTRTATTLTNPSTNSGKPGYYRVRPGDTLSDVAERFDTTVDVLFALNPSIDPNALRIGQRLRVR